MLKLPPETSRQRQVVEIDIRLPGHPVEAVCREIGSPCAAAQES